MRIFPKLKFWTKFILLIILLLVVLNFSPVSKKAKNFFYFISSPIQKTLWKAGDRASDFFEMIYQIKYLKKENEELKITTQELSVKKAEISELEKENKILREALGVGLEKEFKLILAEVTGKDIFQDVLIINKGIKDGLKNNLPVITQQKVLVGKIGEVYDNSSKIILISNKNSAFDVCISRGEEIEEISGVVKGKEKNQLYLDLVSQEKEIKEGDLIITTSLGGVFPKGLLVGEIQKVKKSDVEPFQQAEIKPAFDIKELGEVFIIKK